MINSKFIHQWDSDYVVPHVIDRNLDCIIAYALIYTTYSSELQRYDGDIVPVVVDSAISLFHTITFTINESLQRTFRRSREWIDVRTMPQTHGTTKQVNFQQQSMYAL